MYEQILFEVQDGVATLTLNRPDRLNALTTPMTRELLEALKTCQRDAGIRAVVLGGAGRAFSAGQDLTEFGELRGSVSEHLRHGFNRVVMGLRALEKPVRRIASINLGRDLTGASTSSRGPSTAPLKAVAPRASSSS